MFSVLSSIPIREAEAGGYQMCRRQDPLKTAFGLKDHYSTELQFATHVEAQNREGTIFLNSLRNIICPGAVLS